MNKDSLSFLTSLLETPSPSGFEQRIQRVVKKRVTSFADEVKVDVHGNLIAALNPDAKVRVMLAGHCDQIGLMVTHVNDSGFIHFNQIGGIDASVLPGSRVTIQTREGEIDGVIGLKPVHLVSAGDRGKKYELEQLWIDIGATDGKEARSLISVGDPITYRLGSQLLGKNMITSPGLDNRVGVFVVMEALRIVASKMKKRSSPLALFAVSTVQEEIGLRGAKTSCFGIDPLVGIAADVTHASDNPGAEAKQIGTVKLGGGPTIARGANINPIVEELFVKTAKKKRIPYQPISAPNAAGNDGNVIQISRSGVATGIIGLPNRYMHTQVEVCDLRDLENAAKLIAETVLSITARMSFIPV